MRGCSLRFLDQKSRIILSIVSKKSNNTSLLEMFVFVLAFSLFLLFAMTQLSKRLFPLVQKPNPNSSEITQREIQSLEIPIITYHYIEIVKDQSDLIRKSLAISPADLKKEILELKNQGYRFIFVKDIPDLLNQKPLPSGKFVALTFDDGYRDFYTDAFPVIKEASIKVTVFVISSFINYKNYMTEEQIKNILESGLVEIGAHSMNHYDLTSANQELLQAQIQGSKNSLEQKFGIKVLSFAYPYGQFNDQTASMVKKTGYTSAVSDIQGATQSLDNIFFLSRIRVGYFFKFK